MDSKIEPSCLERLSADVLSDIFRFLSMSDIFVAFLAFPHRIRTVMSRQSVKELHCLSDTSNHMLSLTIRRNYWVRPSLLNLPSTLASFRMLTVLHIVSDTTFGGQLSVLRVLPEVMHSLAPTLKRLRLHQPSVMSAFFEHPPKRPPSDQPMSSDEMEPIAWINVANMFPALESLVLTERCFAAYPPYVFTIQDGLSFLTTLPHTLIELSAPVIFGLHEQVLQLLPPSLSSFTAVRSSQIVASPAEDPHLSPRNAHMLPTSLTNLTMSERCLVVQSDLFLESLSSLQSLTITLDSTDDKLHYPPNLRYLCVTFARERTFSSLSRLPKFLETLVVLNNWSTIGLRGQNLASLPASLTCLDLSNSAISCMDRSDLLLLPPNLRSLVWSGQGTEHFDILPKSLTTYKVNAWQRSDLPNPRLLWSQLPPNLTTFHSQHKHVICAETFKHLPYLTSLVTPRGSIDEDIFFSLPRQLKELTAESIRGCGYHLPLNLTSVTPRDVKQSITSALKDMDIHFKYSKIEAIELRALPPKVRKVEILSIAAIKPKDLPRPLTTIHMPYEFDSSEIVDLPPSLTTLNTSSTITSKQLELLPNTLSSFKRGRIIVNHSADELRLLVNVKSIHFPSIVPALIRKRFEPRLYILADWQLDAVAQYASLITEDAEEVVFESGSYVDWTPETFSWLPASLTRLDILSAPLYSRFCTFCSTLTAEILFPNVKYATFSVVQADGPLALPGRVQTLTLHMGDFTHSPNPLLQTSWPDSLTKLTWTNFKTDLMLLSIIPPSVTSLHIHGQRFVPLLLDDDMFLLPRQLTSLTMDHVHLTKACLNGMPPNLTELTIPKPMFPAKEILSVLAKRRESIAAAQRLSAQKGL